MIDNKNVDSSSKFPIFSFIVPCYNSHKTIEKCIKSIKSQTYKDFECILYDDGSTDDTKEIIFNLIKNDKRFKYFYHDNCGTSETTNAAIKECFGEYIIDVDHDDWIESCLLEILFEIVNKHHPDVIGFESDRITEQSKISLFTYKDDFVFSNKEEEIFLMFTSTRMHITHSSTCIKKELLNGLRFFGYGYFADTIIMRMISIKCSSVAYTSNILYHRFWDLNSVSRKKQEDDIYISYFERLANYSWLFKPNFYYPVFEDTMNIYIDSIAYSGYSKKYKKRIKNIGKFIYNFRGNLLAEKYRRIKYYLYLLHPCLVHIQYFKKSK